MDLILLYLAVLLILTPILYNYGVSIVTDYFPFIRDKSICFLIAHPDDEAMFFAPTVLALTCPDKNNRVTILCLSDGDAEGLGAIRKKELVKSGLILGLRRDDIMITDNPQYAVVPASPFILINPTLRSQDVSNTYCE